MRQTPFNKQRKASCRLSRSFTIRPLASRRYSPCSCKYFLREANVWFTKNTSGPVVMWQRVHSGCDDRRVVGSGQSVQCWLPAEEQGIACQALSGAGTDDNNRNTSPRFSGGAGRSESQNGSNTPGEWNWSGAQRKGFATGAVAEGLWQPKLPASFQGVGLTSDGGFVAGGYTLEYNGQNEVYVVKTDSGGNLNNCANVQGTSAIVASLPESASAAKLTVTASAYKAGTGTLSASSTSFTLATECSGNWRGTEGSGRPWGDQDLLELSAIALETVGSEPVLACCGRNGLQQASPLPQLVGQKISSADASVHHDRWGGHPATSCSTLRRFPGWAIRLCRVWPGWLRRFVSRILQPMPT